MRDSNFDSQGFVLQLERRARSVVSSGESLTRSALANSNPEWRLFQNEFRIKKTKKASLHRLITLSILSWYMPEEDGILVRECIQKYVNSDTIILEFLLKSKGHCLVFLEETSLFHTRDFFGNILEERWCKDCIKLLQPVYLNVNPRDYSVRKTIRRRGYKDKGTWRPSSEHHGIPVNVISEEELEKQKKDYSDSINFIEGIIGTG